MKIYISVDMEGIAGVATAKQVQPQEKEYERFRRLMTHEANAAVEGALAGGASEVVVSDGHGPMNNILVEELHPEARLLSGSNRLLGQLEGIDETFAAAFFIGYHQREGGGDGILNHTLLGRIVQEVRLNGEAVDEAAINAGLAGVFGVPVALVAGDTAVCAEAERRLPGVLVAPVKEGLDRYVGLSVTPQKAQALIRQRARDAVGAVRNGRVAPYRVPLPVTFEVDFKRTAPGRMATLFPSGGSSCSGGASSSAWRRLRACCDPPDGADRAGRSDYGVAAGPRPCRRALRGITDAPLDFKAK